MIHDDQFAWFEEPSDWLYIHIYIYIYIYTYITCLIYDEILHVL